LTPCKAAIDRQKRNLAQGVIDTYRSALANEKYLAQEMEVQKKVVNDIEEKSVQYNILKRDVDTNKELYQALMTRQKEAMVSAGVQASNVRIVDAAEVPKGRREAPGAPQPGARIYAGPGLGHRSGISARVS
jgi:polysaccharide biosynthesis transport protein